jgi:hypothetical protein
LPTIIGSFFFESFAFAFCARFSLSAAKPTQKGGSGSAATQARISGFSSSSSERCPFAFLIFCATGFFTR